MTIPDILDTIRSCADVAEMKGLNAVPENLRKAADALAREIENMERKSK